MNTRRIIYLVLSLLIILFFTIFFKKKTIEIVFISGVKTSFLLEVELNNELVFVDSIYRSMVPLRFDIETSRIKNTLNFVNKKQGIEESYDFYCLFDKWIILGFYKEEEGFNPSSISVSISSQYSQYFSW